MQLNLYVPKERERVVRALDELARRSGRNKNMIALEAIDQYVQAQAGEAGSRGLRTFRLGVKPWSREDLYEERTDHILSGRELRIAEAPAEEYKP